MNIFVIPLADHGGMGGDAGRPEERRAVIPARLAEIGAAMTARRRCYNF
ncbi:MAG: hypothetical protein LBB66_10250 [Desulfovibrio sp.]|nr:hypothetical protein [Desulfovibrio sp.]